MKRCIYCRQEKDDDQFTLEHVIPQFLGGAYTPESFKIRDVCKNCNNNLGLFVDAGFEKNWLVSNNLRQAAYAFFDPENPTGLPLICMGNSDLVPPQLHEHEVCETWLCPLGEQIFWIRPHDERLFWYAGGNPRTAKKVESRAYFLFSERSLKNPLITWLAFRDAFEGRRVKKIMCTTVYGSNPEDIGFKRPDELDQLRIVFFNKACAGMQLRQNQIPFYTHFDFRFLAKLGIGISYALFGEKTLNTKYADELYKGLWHKEGDPQPQINGKTALFHKSDPIFQKLTGEENSVTIIIQPFPEGITLSLNLGTSLNWIIKFAELNNLSSKEIELIKDGYVILLFRQLKRGITMTLADYLAHKTGLKKHAELLEISSMFELHKDYFKNL